MDRPPDSSIASSLHEPATTAGWLDSVIEHKRLIEERLKRIPNEMLALQALLDSLLDEKTRLQQQRRRAESLIAFGLSPRLPRDHNYCPSCYVSHGSKARLVVPATDSAGKQLQCELCGTRFAPPRPGTE